MLKYVQSPAGSWTTMIRATTLATLLLIASLAGCLSDDAADLQTGDGVDGGTTDRGNETADGGNGTGPTPAPRNAPPTANLTANVTNGSAPLAVSFDLTGEDADGDNLTWSFDADGDGEADADGAELPASFEYVYDEPGNYTAVLNVSDAEVSTAAELLIVVEVAVQAGPLICDRPGATSYGGTLYTLNEGGTWFFRESNGMPGLQVENNHPTGHDLFTNDAWADCEQGDQMVL